MRSDFREEFLAMAEKESAKYGADCKSYAIGWLLAMVSEKDMARSLAWRREHPLDY